ncbi:MAG: hypothetical protein ACQEQO_09095 [Thermodesulfobacteriota bacterium]
MPLAFHSLSHGRIAFGFFNIETDLLLLEKYFFFAHLFCDMVATIASWNNHKLDHVILPGYVIDRVGNIGNLMGAIQGTDLRGFIGAVYQLSPFPQNPEDFKQRLNGKADRAAVEKIITRWGQPTNILVKVAAKSQGVKIAELVFSKTALHELVSYVWRGGMPGWQDDNGPDYVKKMKDVINTSVSPLFMDFDL